MYFDFDNTVGTTGVNAAGGLTFGTAVAGNVSLTQTNGTTSLYTGFTLQTDSQPGGGFFGTGTTLSIFGIANNIGANIDQYITGNGS